jgi:hypothetical protein
MNYILYKIYYGDELVYIGRTKQDLKNRLRNHFFGSNGMAKKLDIFMTTCIEYCLCETEADMNLLEIYLICKYKPCINKDDVPKDDLTIHLPEPRFYPYWDKIIDKWKEKQIEQLIDTSPLGSPFEDDFYFF